MGAGGFISQLMTLLTPAHGAAFNSSSIRQYVQGKWPQMDPSFLENLPLISCFQILDPFVSLGGTPLGKILSYPPLQTYQSTAAGTSLIDYALTLHRLKGLQDVLKLQGIPQEAKGSSQNFLERPYDAEMSLEKQAEDLREGADSLMKFVCDDLQKAEKKSDLKEKKALYVRAFSHLKNAVEGGSSEAIILSGMHHLYGGFHQPTDSHKGVEYLEWLADVKNDPIAQCQLALLENNPEENLRKGKDLCLKLCKLPEGEQQGTLANRVVGLMYLRGMGFSQNKEKAYEYFKEGEKRGDPICHRFMILRVLEDPQASLEEKKNAADLLEKLSIHTGDPVAKTLLEKSERLLNEPSRKNLVDDSREKGKEKIKEESPEKEEEASHTQQLCQALRGVIADTDESFLYSYNVGKRSIVGKVEINDLEMIKTVEGNSSLPDSTSQEIPSIESVATVVHGLSEVFKEGSDAYEKKEYGKLAVSVSSFVAKNWHSIVSLAKLGQNGVIAGVYYLDVGFDWASQTAVETFDLSPSSRKMIRFALWSGTFAGCCATTYWIIFPWIKTAYGFVSSATVSAGAAAAGVGAGATAATAATVATNILNDTVVQQAATTGAEATVSQATEAVVTEIVDKAASLASGGK